MGGPSRRVRGGVSAVVNALLKSMPDDAPSVTYVATHVDGPVLVKSLAAATGAMRIVAAVLFGRRRVVHLHMASNASYARKSAILRIVRVLGARTIVHVHGGGFHYFYRDANERLKRSITRTLNAADLVIALSDEWSARLRRIAPGATIRVLRNPVVVDDFTPANECREEVPENGGTVLFLGAFLKRKGIYDLIEAMPAVIEGRGDVVFELGGDNEVAGVSELLASRGIEKNVSLLGWVRGVDKLAAFTRAHVYVLPSYFEGVPIGVLEAQAAGLPVVTTPVGGIPEVVRDGINGFVISPGDRKALSSSILKLLNNDSLRARMSEANISFVRSRHDASLVAKTLCKWYNELANRA
jgi:glycosyltransferase involved in cell wall biosynthesis